MLEPIKRIKGCLNFRLYVDPADENSSLLMSEWETESDLNNYLRSHDFAILHGAITVLSQGSDDLRATANIAARSDRKTRSV